MFPCCCEIQQEHKMKLTSSAYYKAVVFFFLPSQKILLSFIKKHINFILGERQPIILVKILETAQVHHQIRENTVQTSERGSQVAPAAWRDLKSSIQLPWVERCSSSPGLSFYIQKGRTV